MNIDRITTAATLTALSLSTASATVSCAKPQKESRRPNILFIMADDHAYRAISAYGGDLIETPNIDRLAREGMRFDRCFVPNSLSGPSRACILTSKFSHKNGFTDNSHVFDGDQQTFPKLLQAAGYNTAVIGKWHLTSMPQGFDHYDILVGQGEYYCSDFINEQGRYRSEGYATDLIADKSIEWLEGRKSSDQPFALLCWHKAPHRCWIPPQRYMGIYNQTTFPEPDNLFDDYSTRTRAAHEQQMEIDRHFREGWDLKLVKPDQMDKDDPQLVYADANNLNVGEWKARQYDARSIQGVYNRMNDEQKRAWDEAYADRIAQYENNTMTHDELVRWKYQQYMQDYCATIKALDDNVGRVIDYLESIGELDNTIVIYTSDQGFYTGEHGWFDKRFAYEESLRTPMIVRYPAAVKSGTSTEALVMNIDIAPTLLDYAQTAIPTDMQGCSMRTVWEAGGKTPRHWRDAVYYHYYEYPAEHAVKRHTAVRTDRYKLIHFYNDCDQWELYDLKNDPHEMHNLYDDPAYAKIADDMHHRLDSIQEQYEDDSE